MFFFGHALAGVKLEGSLNVENSVINMVFGARRLLTRSGDDGHAKAGAKTGGDLVLVRTE